MAPRPPSPSTSSRSSRPTRRTPSTSRTSRTSSAAVGSRLRAPDLDGFAQCALGCPPRWARAEPRRETADMTCLCSQKLTALAELMASLEAPTIGIPGPLAELSAAMSAALSAQAGASYGLSAAAMAQLSAMAQATACAQAGLGLDLTAPGAQAQLDATIAAANMNAPAFASFGGLDMAPWLSLSELAALSMKLQLGFGVGILTAGAFASLSAALSAGAALSSSLAASAQADASLSAMASAMGVADLSAGGGGMSSLEAKLSAVASLTFPAIEISLGLLLPPLAILGAIANINLAFGLNALAPDFPGAMTSM